MSITCRENRNCGCYSQSTDEPGERWTFCKNHQREMDAIDTRIKNMNKQVEVAKRELSLLRRTIIKKEKQLKK